MWYVVWEQCRSWLTGQFATLMCVVVRVGSSPTCSVYNMIRCHVLELKYRLYYMLLSVLFTTTLLWYSKEKLVYSLTPLNLIYTEFLEAFVSFVILSLSVSVLLNVPYVMLMLYGYVKEGLYDWEVLFFSKYMYLLFILFILLMYSYVKLLLPCLLFFFSSFDSEWLSMCIKIEDVVWLLILLMMSSLLTLLLPLMCWRFDISRKYLIMLILLLSSMLTPPDVMSQLLLGLPLIILLECSILLGYYFK